MFNDLDKLKEENLRGSFYNTTQLPILFVMEFVQGITIDKLHKQLSAKSHWGFKVFTDMGKMLAYDILINNWDRFPFLWRKETGNCGNFLFCTEDQDRPLRGIDQSVTSIVPMVSPASRKCYEEYYAKIQSVIFDLLGFSSEDPIGTAPSGIYGVMEFLKENYSMEGIVFGKEDFCAVVVGLMRGMVGIALGITRELLEGLYGTYEKEVSDLIGRMTWGMDVTGRYGLVKVDIQYLDNIIQLFKTHADSLTQKINQIETNNTLITLNNY